MNPVVPLDEVDKVGSDHRGDPSAALLEVLDPAQNHTFRDHYLELDLDLSDVLFIATANVVEQIPSALLDRMELVTLDGYTEDDKVAIARDFLLPRQLERAAVTESEVTVWTRRCASSRRTTPARPACASSSGCSPRCCARRPRGSRPVCPASTSTGTTWSLWVGRPRFTPSRPSAPGARRRDRPGCVTGPAATCCSSRPRPTTGATGLTLTGQLWRGDEGVRADRPLLRPLPRGRARRRRGRARPGVPRARARGRRTQATGRRPASRW